MAEEKVKILSLDVGTQDAVKNIADLQNNIKLLKEQLKDATASFEDNQKATELLRANQAALKNAMYSTTGTMADVTKAAQGAGETYNALVKRMADLKTELRATDVSTAEGAARFKELAGQINGVNDRLKEMDAMQGNFQRNVGNYTNSIKSAFKDLGEKTDALRKGLGSMSGGLNGVKDGMEGIAKSPMMATFGILVSLAMKLASELKDNEKAMEGVKKAMTALKPVMDFFQGVLDTVIDYIVELADKVMSWLGDSGILNKVIKGVMGVGNAILDFVVAPFKGVIAAIKVFQDEGIRGFRNATKAFTQEMKSGISFKQNFQTGQAMADTFAAGVRDRKKEVKAAAEVGKEAAETALADWEKALSQGEKRISEINKRFEDDQKEADAWIKSETESIVAEIDAMWLAEFEAQEESKRKTEETAAAKIATLKAMASATSSILGSIADMYESDSENSEKNANKIKALRIAAATIDTISGAIGAYTQAAETIPPPYGIIVGAAQAATVTASGLAQIAKIKSTKVEAKAGAASATPAAVSAPSPVMDVPRVRNLATDSDMTRLNSAMDDVQVYVLSSDIEARSNSHKVTVRESSF